MKVTINTCRFLDIDDFFYTIAHFLASFLCFDICKMLFNRCMAPSKRTIVFSRIEKKPKELLFYPVQIALVLPLPYRQNTCHEQIVLKLINSCSSALLIFHPPSLPSRVAVLGDNFAAKNSVNDDFVSTQLNATVFT